MNNMYTVSDLNRMVKGHLENNLSLRNIFVEGEVSNLTYHPSGHLYFSLKDNLCSVKCVAFNYRSKGIDHNIKNGEMLRILARVTLYEVSGQYQLLCESVKKKEQEGDGYEKLKILKEKLMKLGYFDQARKREIPLAFNIGIVTAENGAVLKDIIVTSKKKFENINIIAFPARVQGEDAEHAIVHGIEFLNTLDEIDLIIVGRGGGSAEDLKAFNTESVANAIFNSKKPIISAVGHETDFVISDYVADKRASTPTQAADIVTPSKKALKELLLLKAEKLNKHLLNIFDNLKYQLEVRKNNYILRTFTDDVFQNRIYINEMIKRLQKPITRTMEENRQKIDFSKNVLDKMILNLNENKKRDFYYKIDILKNLNPLNILSRGYAVVEKNNKVITSIKDIKKDEIIITRLEDGSFKSRVID